jgi:mono/diheme cytochrome c family protein
MMRAVMRRRAPIVLAVLASATVLAACGSEGNSVRDSATVERGSQLFAERCSGCHTLAKVGAQGSASKVRDRERVDGPNFNVRKECAENVLYAIRNGGYSGAIMPENIVVGKDADDVAQFLEKYSGLKARPAAGAANQKCGTAAG